MNPLYDRIRREDMVRVFERLGYQEVHGFYECPGRGRAIIDEPPLPYYFPVIVDFLLTRARLADVDFERLLRFDPDEDPRYHELPEDAQLILLAGNKHKVALYQGLHVRDLTPALEHAGYRRVEGKPGRWANAEGESLQLPQDPATELSPRQVWWALCSLRLPDREFARLRREGGVVDEAA